MHVIVTVKMIPEKGCIIDPIDAQTVIEGYTRVRDAGTLGQPDLVSLRFLIEGNGNAAEVKVPDVQENASVPVEAIPIIEKE